MKYLYKISNNDYLKYFSLISTIPNKYKEKLKNEAPHIPYNNNNLQDLIQKQKNVNKLLYNVQIKTEKANEKN